MYPQNEKLISFTYVQSYIDSIPIVIYEAVPTGWLVIHGFLNRLYYNLFRALFPVFQFGGASCIRLTHELTSIKGGQAHRQSLYLTMCVYMYICMYVCTYVCPARNCG